MRIDPDIFHLDPIEARLLGCLIEKAALTPEAYPLTVNSAVTAANQKTSREPVMHLEPGAVEHTLRGLEDRKLVAVIHGSRAHRYEHRLDTAWQLTPKQRALLAMLFLRGPQTLPELHLRCERLARFESPDDVREVLMRLAHRTPALVVNMGRQAGQREDRYMHLCSGPVAVHSPTGGDDLDVNGELPRRVEAGLAARVTELEARVAEMEARLGALEQAGTTAAPNL
jgi:uncharacterized protein YceH (UPF0502 family)